MEREIHSSFLPRPWKPAVEMFVVASVLAACFDIIPAPLEYFGHMLRIMRVLYLTQGSQVCPP